MNNKGFTMVELLVAMAIMGLLIIMAFPTIRAIQTNNNNTKYKEYGTSAISATKIYTDSYAEDLFDDEQSNEFKVVYFDELAKKDLIKDINISDSTCIIESSVTVVKYKDDYSYCLHLICKSKNNKPGDKPLYEENNRRGNCSKFTPRKVNYIYDTTKSKDAVDGDENYIVLHPSKFGFNFNANHDVFLKWNTKRDGTGKTYYPGDKLDKIEGDVNLYAITRKWEYYLHLNKGIGDSGTITDNPHKCVYGSDCSIPDNKYSKVGYTFDGWSDGTNKYSNKENVKTRIGNNIPGDGHKVYLTATFKIKSCTVTYSPNGGVFNNHANDTVQTVNWGSYYGDATDGMRNSLGGHYNATRIGYHLEEATAWTNGSKTFDQRKRYLAQEVCDLSVKSNSTTLKANWKISSYTCAAGKYLKKGATSCSDCISGNYCPGGTFYYNESNVQGLNSCPSGYGNSPTGSSKNTQCYMKVSKNYYVKNAKDSSATKCPSGEQSDAHNVNYGNKSNCNKTIPTYTCIAGNYLPKNKKSCVPCINAYYCKGGTWQLSTSADQGLTPCPNGYKNSPNGSKEEKQCFMKVPKNYYVRNAKESSTNACPTGEQKDAHNVNYGSTSRCVKKKFTIKVAKSTGIKSVTLDGSSSTLTKTVDYGTKVKIQASAEKYYQFTEWSDSDKNKTRTVEVKSNITLTAKARKNTMLLVRNLNGGSLRVGDKQVCAKSAGCKSNECDWYTDSNGKKTDHPGCTGKSSGVVFKGNAYPYDSTIFKNNGTKNYCGEKAHLRAKHSKKSCKNNKDKSYWIVGTPTSAKGDAKIDQTKEYDTVEKFVRACSTSKQNHIKDFETKDITIYLYAEWY